MNDCCYKCLLKCFDSIYQVLERISCSVKGVQCSVDSIDLSDVTTVKRMLAHNNPMTVAAEYPAVEEDRFVVNTPVRFLDMLNSDMFVIFKIDNNSSTLPVYFKDSSDYEHRVVLADATPVLANQIQLNGIYPAKYQYTSGYIILDSLTPLNPDIIND